MKHILLFILSSAISFGAFAQGISGYQVSFVKIGTTYYDMPTTASVGRHIVKDANGNIATCWSYSGKPELKPTQNSCVVNQRVNGKWNAIPNKRIISEDVQSPSIGILRDGSVYVTCTGNPTGDLMVTTNSGMGNNSWVTEKPAGLNITQGSLRWSRATNVGDTLYMIGMLYSETQVVKRNGIINPIVYSRSVDKGENWSILQPLPGYDSLRIREGSREAYAIDAKDSIVAVLIGGAFQDVTLYKSVDYGQTWSTTIIDSFRFPRFQWGKHYANDTNPAMSNDGSLDVVIDNNGDVHTACGRITYSDEDTTDSNARSTSHYDLFHWSENHPKWKVCGSPIDMDGQLAPSGLPYDITSETTNSIDSIGNPMHGLSYAARYENTSISTHPSLSVDRENNVFVTWDSPVEMTFNDFLANYRDVHISFTSDGGKTWASPQNITKMRSKEAAFASMARHTKDHIHMVFHVDDHPGTYFRKDAVAQFHPNDANDIYYAIIPVKEVMDSTIGTHSVKNVNKPKVFVVSQNQPNPFSDNTKVVVYLRAGSDLTCTITDATGKVVSNQAMGYRGAGNHKISIDGSDLTSGVYFYTLKTKDSEVTKKMQVY